MAAQSPVESLWEEAMPPVCLEDFTAPVTLECGHNVYQDCLSPQCRDTAQQGTLQSNRELANMAELAKRLSFQAPMVLPIKEATQEYKVQSCCPVHRCDTTFYFSCTLKALQSSGCVSTYIKSLQRPDLAVLVATSGRPHEEKLETHLKRLRKERENLLEWKVTAERKTKEYLKQTQAERQKIVAEFQQLRQGQFLEEQERLLLAQLEKLYEEIRRLQTDANRKLSAQISRLSEQIVELEGTCQKPVSDFLQDVRNTLNRCEMGQFQLPEEIFRGFSQKTIALSESLREFKGTWKCKNLKFNDSFRNREVPFVGLVKIHLDFARF
uniref:Zinc finger RING-type eukaryotic domain-containing protein n=1 Tax=Pelodiscus sinensis TaxID=13735 RepID=K7F5E0_PELSI